MFGRKAKAENILLKKEIATLKATIKELAVINDELADKVEEYMKKYPLELGQVVYDVQLRSSKGTFTKTKACKQHSTINELVVDKKNYFKLVDKFATNTLFVDIKDAESYLDSICVE